MILQALTAYYGRLRAEANPRIPAFGFARRPISFALVVNSHGTLLQVQDLREQSGNNLVPKQLAVPTLGRKKSVGIDPDFLWGSTGYVLGSDNDNNPRRTAEKFKQFKTLQHQVAGALDNEDIQAVIRFLDAWHPRDARFLPSWSEMVGTNIVFRLDGRLQYVHETKEAANAWSEYFRNDDVGGEGICLVTGQRVRIARLHPGIKGVDGTATAEAALVSFNETSSVSLGKDQNFNAPIGKDAAFAYSSALNHLLARDNRQRVKVGDAITVYWTARKSPMEGFMGMILNPREDAGDLQSVRLVLDAVREGRKPLELGDPEIPFFILGLSPNAARISVRFWHISTVGDMLEKIEQHFGDLAITHGDRDPEFPGMWQLLRETAAQGKPENIPPLLAGALMRSILTGAAYPQSLLSILIGRIRADQRVNYLRAAMIKAYLNRKYRIYRKAEEVTMSLDKESMNVAYRLGRLFAILEKAQKDAIPGANTTIKDRFYGSASATPSTVFPQLLRLAQHHIQKAEYGNRTDKMIEEVMQGIERFPSYLSLDEQGMFAIGYYHQRQAFFSKSENQKEGE